MSLETKKRKYRLKGHESFVLREGWLNKGLREISRNPGLFSNYFGAEELGVGPNMAKSIRYWMRCAGLIEEKRSGVFLTGLGKLLYDRDPYLEKTGSLWLLHCNIARNERQATVWNLFFNRFDREDFTPEDLKGEMDRMVKTLPGIGSYSRRSLEDDCDAVLRMYTRRRDKSTTPEEKNTSPFSALGLIRQKNGSYSKVQPDFTRLPEEILWYLFPRQTDSVSIDTLLEEKNGPGKILNLKRNGLLELLGRLAARDILHINRTAGLDMVYMSQKTAPDDIIKKYYA